MTATDWAARHQEASKSLLGQGSEALRQNNLDLAHAAITEAAIILDMSPEIDHTVHELRARAFNELGVIYQRRGDSATSRTFHDQAAALCRVLVDEGREDFRGNSAATHLNLASLSLAMDDFEAAQEAADVAIANIDILLEGEEQAVLGMAVAAYQMLGALHAQRERYEESSTAMARSIELANKALDVGNNTIIVQAAQGCQQASVLLFQKEQFEQALEWGRQAEQLSEKAFDLFGQEALPLYVISQINLISYNERLARYADAEDCLWKALEVVGEDDPRLLKRGKDFYEHCRKQSDKRLEAGNLPRAEVEESYSEILNRIEKIGGLPAELEEEDENQA